ncbi:uncharacterized protein [Watersipora subatra]|uniref:uncharacterized protein n=1 Tax=Watersipora subatra TaxID=2589382 RepID=UPI00355C3051
MGNISEHHNHHSELEDGEEAYETLARDISYLRCVSEEMKPTIKQQNGKQSLKRASSRKRSIRKSQSIRQSCKEPNDGVLLISDLEVQVDGKHAILVPRKSVLEKKGFAKLKSKMAFISRRMSTRKLKPQNTTKVSSAEKPASDKDNQKATPGKDDSANVEKAALTKATSHYIVIPASNNNHTLRHVSVCKSVSNINKLGNMALNIETVIDS